MTVHERITALRHEERGQALVIALVIVMIGMLLGLGAAAYALSASQQSVHDERNRGAQQGRDSSLGAQQIAGQLRIRQLEQGRKPRTLLGRRGLKASLQPAHQQQIKLLDAAAAAPGQKRAIGAQCCRSASMRLIAPMALAGFRSFGQASVQFMIV